MLFAGSLLSANKTTIYTQIYQPSSTWNCAVVYVVSPKVSYLQSSRNGWNRLICLSFKISTVALFLVE